MRFFAAAHTWGLSSRLAPVVAVVALASLFGGCAHTEQTVVRDIADLNQAALKEYKKGDFADAKKLLVRAVVRGKEAGLGEHEAMARTYLNLGAVYLQTKERDKGVRHLALALRIKPDIEAGPEVDGPALNKAMVTARAQARRRRRADKAQAVAKAATEKPAVTEKPEKQAETAAPAPAPVAVKPPPAKVSKRKGRKGEMAVADDEPDLPASIPQPLYCPTPDEAPPEAEIPMRCVPRPGLAVARVILYYRAPGTETFTPVPMVRSKKGWYKAAVPPAAVTGKALQYYVEAHSPARKVATTNGQPESPNVVMIRSGAPPVRDGVLAGLAGPRSDGPDAPDEPDDPNQDDPLAEIEREHEQEMAESRRHRRGASALIFGVGFGSGYGWHPQTTLERRKDLSVAAGMSPASLVHVMPEIGLQLGERFAVSIQSRHQYIPESGSGDVTPGDPKGSAHAVFARAYLFSGVGNLQLFASGTVGGGQGFRLVIPPSTSANLARNDTVRGGPVVLGPGAGVLYHFSRYLALGAELRGLAGIGSTFATVVELNTLLQSSF